MKGFFPFLLFLKHKGENSQYQVFLCYRQKANRQLHKQILLLYNVLGSEKIKMWLNIFSWVTKMMSKCIIKVNNSYVHF